MRRVCLSCLAGLFVVAVAGGVAVGLTVGWLVRQLRRRLDNPQPRQRGDSL